MGLFKRKAEKPRSKAGMDAATLSLMQQRGANLAMRRNVRHYLYGAAESEVQGAAATLRTRGYSVEVSPAATGSGFLALAERVEIVDEGSVAAARHEFEALSAGLAGGDYDGWEAGITPAP